MQTVSVKIIQEFSLNRISNLLCSALEGGSNYWYTISAFGKPNDENLFYMDGDKPGSHVYRHIQYPLSVGGYLIIETKSEEIAGESENPQRLDLASIQRGLQVMADKYPHHYAHFLNMNDDSETGDVFLQCCLFGETIFG